MKISTEISSIALHVGEEKAVRYVAEAGFDAWDFSMFSMCRWDWTTNSPSFTDHPLNGKNYLKFARELKKIGLDNGIVCNQSHAPFPSKPIMYDHLLRAIECTAEVGGEICVIHPNTYKTHEENIKYNAELYNKLLPFAKDHGVKIATENMWSWDKEKDVAAIAACTTPKGFGDLFETVNDEYLIACLDIGHAEMMGNITNSVELIHSLGNKLKALHIHDNDKWKDLHQIPFSKSIDFAPIAKALKYIKYDGYFTLECDCFLKGCPDNNLMENIRKLAESAKKFGELFAKA